MDTNQVMGALNNALEQHDLPEIVNTDQGSQYTSEGHMSCLSRYNATRI